MDGRQRRDYQKRTDDGNPVCIRCLAVLEAGNWAHETGPYFLCRDCYQKQPVAPRTGATGFLTSEDGRLVVR